MSREIVLQKATRIEGNADIHIEVEDGELKAARFMVQDFRAFEKIMIGKRIELAPHIISRICGLCSTAHQVAGFRAVENALGLEVEPSVDMLRQVALLGERISSHALSYFFLTYPDLIGSSKGLFDLKKMYPKVAEDAFFLRKAGNRIIEIVGKRAVHPVSMAVGRFNILPTEEELNEIKRIAAEIKATTYHLISTLDKDHYGHNSIPYPAGQRVNFLTYDGRPGREKFRVFDDQGKVCQEFSGDSLEDHISELRVDWSFAKFPYLTHMGFPGGILLVGPLSRVYQDNGVLQDEDLKDLGITKHLKQNVTTYLDSFDTARLLEIFLSAKQILALLKKIKLQDLATPEIDFDVSGRGIGIVEAPRGVLVHSYLVNRGKIERLRLLVATQFNNAYINMVLRDLAQGHISGNSISPQGEKQIGRCIRMFDPCLTCATH
ncbi:MAG: Ni/Fe hydrogenase subunit alpha [Proteobacteria bacterium]|nr:Ni/Fe hydrogenase subunit alpha [Pseudomonadota bacterium]MBU1709292.1 Ni/Fe hydrogenase subunit alpha [Pseudomonadota bacterium]